MLKCWRTLWAGHVNRMTERGQFKDQKEHVRRITGCGMYVTDPKLHPVEGFGIKVLVVLNFLVGFYHRISFKSKDYIALKEM